MTDYYTWPPSIITDITISEHEDDIIILFELEADYDTRVPVK